MRPVCWVARVSTAAPPRPLSAAGHGSRDTTWIVLSVLVHMVLVGIPIAFLTRNAFAAK
ncbi:MAG: hypothetical protein WB812_08530 [Woeseiaceae bacterium]